MKRSLPGLLVVVAFALAPRPAVATCGSDMCTLDSRGPESAIGRWSFDVNSQFIDQDDVRVGTEPGFVGQIPADHNEVETQSEIYSLTARGTMNDRLLLSTTLPWMHRRHVHEHEHHPGLYETQSWDFTGFGDLMLGGYYTAMRSASWALSVNGGFKLPTGKKNVEEVDGDQPEPMTRPSTGSFDVLLGTQLRRDVTAKTLLGGEELTVPFSLGAGARLNGTGTDDYKMGDEMVVNLAGGWPVSPAVTVLGQVNARFRGKDEAGLTDTDPENTGGQAVYASPGFSVRTRGGMGFYGYFQTRLYEKVNGIQITAPNHLMFGMNYSL